ncbi:MAG: hypothetical protein P4L39_07035 [Humidesulfovibrio sp.]|nr:hypothetical protein [Humidesulfovibrio sp.]
MEKREKILLGVMGATLVVAGMVFFSGPANVPGPPGAAAPQINMGEMTQGVEQAKLTAGQAYRLSLLAQNSTADPFYGGIGGLAQDDSGQDNAQALVYSGYIKIGLKVFAVVNGIEYACGDQLAEGGYVVKAIDKNAVLLERTDSSNGHKSTKRVPLVEDDTDKIRIRVVKQR